jgi:hypothetical protein
MDRHNPRTIGRRVIVLVVAALVGLVSGQTSHALVTTANRLTFGGPVALPGVVLPAGSYSFEVMDPVARIVSVWNRDRTRVLFVGPTIETERPRTISAAQAIAFGEASVGAPQPIRVWYPVGRATGHQFIYR